MHTKRIPVSAVSKTRANGAGEFAGGGVQRKKNLILKKGVKAVGRDHSQVQPSFTQVGREPLDHFRGNLLLSNIFPFSSGSTRGSTVVARLKYQIVFAIWVTGLCSKLTMCLFRLICHFF